MCTNIYHYTKDLNVDSIIEKKALWAILSTQSNDLTDTIYISTLITSLGRSLIERIVSNDDNVNNEEKEKVVESVSSLLGNLVDMFCNDRADIYSKEAKAEKCFVICFTDLKDSRFLWDAYAKNRGINIGIHIEDLKEYIDKMNQNLFSHYQIDKVIYDENEQEELIYSILNKNYEKYYNYHDATISEYTMIHKSKLIIELDGVKSAYNLSPIMSTLRKNISDFMSNTCRDLLYVAPYIKHPFWNEENEYRLTFYRTFLDPNLESIRTMKNEDESIKFHYIQIPFDFNITNEIHIGPCSEVGIDRLGQICNKITKSAGTGVFNGLLL